MTQILTLPLRSEGDVVAARLTARRIAEMVGLDRLAQTRVATALSEVARNACSHGGGGEVSFSLDAELQPRLLTMTVADQGPGIARLDDILAGQLRLPAGRGRGLFSARRLVDEFDIRSSAAGTRVQLSQRIPRQAALKLDAAGIALLLQRARPPRADPIALMREQDHALIDSLEGLAERQQEADRLSRELQETNRGVVALYSELDDTAEQLRQASDLKSRFLSHMSHEFRTPLSSILALSRLLSDRIDGELNAEQERQVEYIRRAAQGLLEMVNDLLDLAKVEAGKLDVKAAGFSVADLFGSLRWSLKPLQTNPAVELVFDDAGALPELFSDEAKVAQILRNFIANALKFTTRGTVSVSAALGADGGHIRFTVSDTGIGIAAADLPSIFDEFSQIDSDLQRGGTGLGLSLSRRLATLLGGVVGVVSALGAGSAFSLQLPLRWGSTPPAPPASPADDTAAAPPRQVLVVDDEESFRYVIRHIAQNAGFAVREAEDGAAALLLARESAPDAVILDLQMPGMDGFATLAAIAGDDVLKQVPTIVCTARLLSLDEKRRLSGAYAIVPKHDLSRDHLTALIEAALQTSGTRHA